MEAKIKGGSPSGYAAGVPGTELLVEQQFQAARAVLKPLDYAFGGQILGHYRFAGMTGLTTVIAAGGAIFSAQWTETKSLMVLTRLAVGAVITTAFGAGQAVDADAVIVRGFTAPDTGGTAIALGVGNKTRSVMGNSLVASMLIATTAALGAGVGVADANAFAINAISQTNAIGTGGSAPTELYNLVNAGQHPVVLGAKEGFRIRIGTTQGATGVVKYYITAEWAEVAAF